MSSDSNLQEYIRQLIVPWADAGHGHTDSTLYQGRGVAPTSPVASDGAGWLERVYGARESGAFAAAIQEAHALLDAPGVAPRVQAQAQVLLADLLECCGAGSVVPRMVAALTLWENLPRALETVRRLRGGAGEVSIPTAIPTFRVLLALGSNFATIAFANAIMRRVPIVGILQQYAEFPVVDPALRPASTAAPLGLSERVCAAFADECAVLGNDWNALYANASTPIRYVSRGEVNGDAVLDWVRSLEPDLIISHGPERLSKSFISSARLGGVNVHWGLSPTYRGMHTARWALLHGRPESVGVTVHQLDSGLDSGPILYQARPQCGGEDNVRRIEYRLSMLAIDMVLRAAEELRSGTARPRPQDRGLGREYRLADWPADGLARLTPSAISRMLAEYHADRLARDASAPLISPWPIPA